MSAPTYITPAQLCIGLYVRLELDWASHPFTFSAFKIKSQEQIDILRSLGLSKIRIIPSRSDSAPLAAPEQAENTVAADEQAAPVPAASINDAIANKRQRLERIGKQRAAINECEKKLLSASRTIKSLTRNLFARPQESLKEAGDLIDGMLDSMLTERDLAIHLMSDRVGGEDVYQHPLNVAILAMMLGKQLKLPAEDIRSLGLGALLHDIGKLELPENLQRKTTALSPAEQSLMERHVLHGLELGKKLELPREVMAIIFHHHEFVDGSGYPKGLKGPEIFPLAKIISVANTYDNLCNKPNPRDSATPYEALASMFSSQRARFEPAPLNLFIRCMGVYPPGTLVQLSNNALGMVIAVNASQPLKPCVLIYDPAIPKREAVILDLEAEPELQVVKSIHPTQLPQEIFDYLNPRKRMTYFFDVSPGGDA